MFVYTIRYRKCDLIPSRAGSDVCYLPGVGERSFGRLTTAGHYNHMYVVDLGEMLIAVSQAFQDHGFGFMLFLLCPICAI